MPRAGLPRPCRGGEGLPGPGRGRGGRSDAAGRDGTGAPAGRRGEKGRGYGPALRLQRFGLPLESEAGAGGATDSHLGAGRPCLGRVRGARQKLEVSGDVGERAGQSAPGDWDAGGSGDEGLLPARPPGEVGVGGVSAAELWRRAGRRWVERASQGRGRRDTSGPFLHQPGMGNLVGG